MKEFKQKIKIESEIGDVFAALTNPFTIELWSGYKAEMDANAGTEFSLWEGDICGVNLEVEEDKRLVQEWYFGEQEEKSIVTMKLFQERRFTKIELTHTNIPDEAYDDICEGWNDFYLGAIKEFLEVDEEG